MYYCAVWGLQYPKVRALLERDAPCHRQRSKARFPYQTGHIKFHCRHASVRQLVRDITRTVVAAAAPGPGRTPEPQPDRGSGTAQPAPTQRTPGSPRFSLVPIESSADKQHPEDNPSLDDIILDEQYYTEMGLSEEDVRESLRQYDATELDPEAENLGPHVLPIMSPSGALLWGASNQLEGLREGGAGKSRQGLFIDEEEEEGDLYGPEAVLLAGFRAEEHGVVRALLDSAGGHVIKVLPVSEAMLYGTVDEAVHTPEVDWAAPRPADGARGGDWGAQRAVLFSGLGFRAQLTVLELLESSGLPAVCAALAREDQSERRLGDVLAEAVAAQRSKASHIPREELWQVAGCSRFADVRRGLPSLGELLGERALERLEVESEPQAAESDMDGAAAAEVAHCAPFEANIQGRDAADCLAPPTGSRDGVRTGAAAGTTIPGTQQDQSVLQGKNQPPESQLQPQPQLQPSEQEDEIGEELSDFWQPDGPVLSPSSQQEAAAAAAEWAAWQTAASEGREDELTSIFGSQLDPSASLAGFGADLEKLREEVIRQLSEMDPEALEEYLVDSPYENGARPPFFQWRDAAADNDDGDGDGNGGGGDDGGEQGESVGQVIMRPMQQQDQAACGSTLHSSTAGVAASSARGVTWNELQRVAERQQQRWLEAQESMETAAAAVGHLVVDAESQLLNTKCESEVAPLQLQQPGQVAASSPRTQPQPASMKWDTTATSIQQPATSAMSPSLPSAKQQQRKQQVQEQQPRPLEPSSLPPEPSEFDLGFGDAFSDLDDLLGQLEPTSVARPAIPAEGPSGPLPALACAAPLSPSLSGPPAANVLEAAMVDPTGNHQEPAASIARGNSILQQVQAAVRSGAPPEVIQTMLDELYGSQTTDRADSTLAVEAPQPVFTGEAKPPAVITPENPLAAAAQSKQRGSLFAHLKSKPNIPTETAEVASAQGANRGNSPVKLRPRKTYGPALPPEPDPVLKPLLQLRPEIAKAVQDKQVKFMDLSRLNDKQKRQFLEYQARLKAQQQRLSQQPGQWTQPTHMQANRTDDETGDSFLGSGKGEAEEKEEEGDGTMAVDSTDGEGIKSEVDDEDETEDDDQNEVGGVSIDADMLQELMAASQQQGLDMEDTLAQAVAMGVRLPEDVLREVGLQPPSEEALQRARDDYSRLFMEWAKEEGLDMSGAPNDGEEDEAAEPEEDGNGDGEDEASLAMGVSMTDAGGSRGVEAPSSSQSSAPRPWGAGLVRPRQRLGRTGAMGDGCC